MITNKHEYITNNGGNESDSSILHLKKLPYLLMTRFMEYADKQNVWRFLRENKFHEDKRNMQDKKKWCFKKIRPVICSLSNATEYDLYLKSQIKKTNYDWYL